ncbi:cytochrome c1 [Acidiphilium sp.]|uniref:cytochrome c1 n=1 Tax=Acidiphilium sp. TaxID=527 RepID=UPI003D029261
MLLVLAAIASARADATPSAWPPWYGGFNRVDLQTGFAAFEADCARCHTLALVTPDEWRRLGLDRSTIATLLTEDRSYSSLAPDLSLFEADHRNGAALVMTLVTAPSAVTPAHPPLSGGTVIEADGKPVPPVILAHDLAAFLAWTADPTLDRRKSIMERAIAFLVVFGMVGYLTLRKRKPS